MFYNKYNDTQATTSTVKFSETMTSVFLRQERDECECACVRSAREEAREAATGRCAVNAT